MKKILLPILIACVSALPTQAQTILTVDVSNAFNNLKEVQAQLVKLNSAADEYRSFLQDKYNKINAEQKKVDELVAQSNNEAILQESRDTFKKEAITQNQTLTTDANDFKTVQANSQQVMTQSQDDLVKSELEKIRTVVKQIATEKKASVVLNSSNLNMLSSVLFASTTDDITQEVVNKLNADYAATNPAPAPSMASGTAKPASMADTSKK